MPNFLPAIVENGQWHPRIGDPTWWGWAIAAGYYLASALCLWDILSARRNVASGAVVGWSILTFVLLALGLGKQFDLAGWVWWSGRTKGIDYVWMLRRRWVEYVIAIAGIVLAVALVIRLWKSARAASPGLVGGIVGAAVCGVLVIARTLSFHWVDDLLSVHLGGLSINRAVELTGIAIVIASSLYAHRSMGRARP